MQPIIYQIPRAITYHAPSVKEIVYNNPEWVQQSWLVTILKEAILEFEEKHRFDLDNGDKWFLSIVKQCLIDDQKYSIKQKEAVEKIFNKKEESL